MLQNSDTEAQQRDHTKTNKALIIASVVITGLLSFVLVYKQYPSVWFDEVASINLITADWNIMWKIIVGDTHPPLYFYIMKTLITVFGNSFRKIKFLQLIPVFAMHLWSGILVIRDKNLIRKPFTGFLTVLFIFATFAPTNFMVQNVEIRMYSWAMFFVTMSGIYAFRLIMDLVQTKPRGSVVDSILFVIFSLSAALTHYYALFCEVFIYLLVFGFVLAMKETPGNKLFRIGKLLIPTVIGYSWWIPFGIKQFREEGDHIEWISFSFKGLVSYMKNQIGFGCIMGLLFIAVVLLEAARLILPEIEAGHFADIKPDLIIGTVFFAMPFFLLFVGTVMSFLFRPFIIERYIFPAMGLFWLGTILIFCRIKGNRKKIYFVILGGAFLFLLFMNYPQKYIDENKNGSKETVEFISSRIDPEDIFVTNMYHLTSVYGGEYFRISVLGYYFPNHTILTANDFLSVIDGFDGTAWLFADLGYQINADVFSEHGVAAEQVYTGNIDNYYCFDIYKIYRTGS